MAAFNLWPFSKIPLGETGWLSNFQSYFSMPLALHLGFLDLWRSPPALSPNYIWLHLIAYFSLLPRDPVFFYPTPTQPVRLHLATFHSLCFTCVTSVHHAMAFGHLVLPTQPLAREAEDFLRSCKCFKYVSLLMYLICFPPKCIYMDGSI